MPETLGLSGSALAHTYAPDMVYLQSLRRLEGEHALGAILLVRHHRTQLRALAHAVQRVYPRTAPADKRNNRELVSYITRMLTQGRYVATFEE